MVCQCRPLGGAQGSESRRRRAGLRQDHSPARSAWVVGRLYLDPVVFHLQSLELALPPYQAMLPLRLVLPLPLPI